MKQLILGTALGRIAMSTRNSVDLIWAALTRSEHVGTLLNDQLASALTAKLCRSNRQFIDVGAHIGSVISSVLEHDPTVKVFAIEAMPDKMKKLRRKFPNIQLSQCAVSETEGEVSFFVNTIKTGYSSLGKPKEGAVGIITITVPTKRLDSLISSDNVDVIKIDVEGAELGVLRGGELTISRSRPVIMFESGPPQDDDLGFSKEDMWSWLNERKFDLLVPNRVAHLGPGLTKDGFVESHFFPRRTTNYFAIPVERREEVMARARKALNLR